VTSPTKNSNPIPSNFKQSRLPASKIWTAL